ncbi:MAG: hypothetical protein HY647_07910 [Acidobacteria bacterium]|nr:hypothetical protein [Acidobacteriota bacterium]
MRWRSLIFSPMKNWNLEEGKPPFFKTWRRLYVAVVVYLVFLILAFTVFTRVFRFPP